LTIKKTESVQEVK